METTIFEIDSVFHKIITDFNDQALAMFHNLAREKLAEQIALGNNTFATYIDRRPSTVADIDKAKKVIRFQFTHNAVKLAIKIMEEELRKSIIETTNKRTGKLRSNIKVFLARKGGSLVEVSNISELDDFQPGDQAFVCPAQPYSGIVLHYVTQASSRKKTAKYGLTKGKRTKKGIVGGGLTRRGHGFIAIAAKRIRSIIGQQPRGAGVSVLGMTSAALIPLVWQGVPSSLVGKGVPCIVVAYKYNQTASVAQV